MLENQGNSAEFTINPDNKFYPEVKSEMWGLNTFLGKFTDSKGINYDLGINLDTFAKEGHAGAVALGNAPGHCFLGDCFEDSEYEFARETYRRAIILNLEPLSCNRHVG
jgi:hypothetical protein